MNRIALLAGGSLLLLAAPTFAQDATESILPPADVAGTEVTAGASVEEAFDAEVTADASATLTPDAPVFTDQQVSGFVQAMTAIQALPGDDAAKQAQAVEIVAEAGIDAATYNAIGETMQTDSTLADRVRVALAAKQSASGV
ncbi:MAG: DUF4168 domain-containing protein [Pseudomonadota bacterium]